jgi:hypothetical protein
MDGICLRSRILKNHKFTTEIHNAPPTHPLMWGAGVHAADPTLATYLPRSTHTYPAAHSSSLAPPPPPLSAASRRRHSYRVQWYQLKK